MDNKLQHTYITLVIQTIVGMSTNNWWLGIIFSMGLFIGREQAQAEQKWIQYFCNNQRTNMKSIFDSFTFKVWDFHSWFWNLFFPILCSILYYILYYILNILYK